MTAIPVTLATLARLPDNPTTRYLTAAIRREQDLERERLRDTRERERQQKARRRERWDRDPWVAETLAQARAQLDLLNQEAGA